MSITKNIVTDYSCPTNGTSDCRAAFLAFKADAQGQTATLNIPAGSYNFKFNPQTNEEFYLFKGIPDLTVNMTGVTFLDDAGVGGYFFGGKGIPGTAGTTARVNSVSAGTSQITCKTHAEASMFTVGTYAMLSGYDLQGSWTSPYGFPPNPQWFEFVKVASVNGTTGVVTFTSPITNTYLDSWPSYAPGQAPDQGGPATLYVLDASWDCTHVYNGGRMTCTNAPLNCAGRSITFNGYTQVIGQNGINPSQNGTIRFIDCTLGFTEVDKLIGTISYEGNTTATQTQFQSSSVDLFYMTGTTNVANLNGTPKRVIADPGTTIGTMRLGPIYGRTDEVYFNGCTISAVTMPGGVTFKGPSGNPGFQVYSMSNGIITIPNTDNAQPWTAPGTWCYWTGLFDTETPFRIVAVTQDATNIYIQTNMTGGFPSVPLTSGKLYITPHPAMKATFINCTGCAEVVDWSQVPSGRPFASYSKRTYTKTTVGAAPSYYVIGNVQNIKFDVTNAFSGIQNPLTFHMAPGDNVVTLGPPTSYTQSNYGPIINLRTAGSRVITPSGVAGTQSGDSGLTLPNAQSWLTGIVSPYVSNDVHTDSSDFNVTVEIIANQGLNTSTIGRGLNSWRNR